MAQWTKFNNPHTWGGKKHSRRRDFTMVYPVETITPDEQKAIDEFDAIWATLTEEDKHDIIVVDGRRYVRKIWEKNHKEECIK